MFIAYTKYMELVCMEKINKNPKIKYSKTLLILLDYLYYSKIVVVLWFECPQKHQSTMLFVWRLQMNANLFSVILFPQ